MRVHADARIQTHKQMRTHRHTLGSTKVQAKGVFCCRGNLQTTQQIFINFHKAAEEQRFYRLWVRIQLEKMQMIVRPQKPQQDYRDPDF
jgi:hypothetical protein